MHCADRDTLSFISQRSSWGYLQVSADTFRKLLAAHSVTSAVSDAVHSFGAKVTGEDDPLYNTCHYGSYTREVENQAKSTAHILGKLIFNITWRDVNNSKMS